MQNVAQSTVGTIERVTPGDLSSLTGALPDVEHPTNCPGCGIALRHEELRRGAYVCSCGHHLPMHADAWIALLADEGTWTERWSALRSRDPLGWTSPRPYARQLEEAERRGLNESVRTGQCRLEDRAIWLAVFDFRVVGGTLGVVAGERLARAGASAARSCTPFVLVTASGGARMQEGVFALMQMAKVNEAVAAMDAARAPFFSVLSSPTRAGCSTTRCTRTWRRCSVSPRSASCTTAGSGSGRWTPLSGREPVSGGRSVDGRLRPLEAHQAHAPRAEDGLRSGSSPELAQDVGHVELDRLHAHAHRRGHLAVASAGRHLLQDLQLAPRQVLHNAEHHSRIHSHRACFLD